MSNGGQRNFDLLMTKISNFVASVEEKSLGEEKLKKKRKEAIEALQALYGVLGWPLDKPAPTPEDLESRTLATDSGEEQRCTGDVPWS